VWLSIGGSDVSGCPRGRCGCGGCGGCGWMASTYTLASLGFGIARSARYALAPLALRARCMSVMYILANVRVVVVCV